MIRTLTTLASFAATVLAFLALAAVLLGAHTPAPHAEAPAPVVAPAVHAGGTAVSSTIDDAEEDAAFLADLFDGSTDYTPEQAFRFEQVGRRYCAQVGHPETRPAGAEVATRAGYLAGLTLPDDPHALTLDEATKLLDTAQAAYCPGMVTHAAG